jgi:hypothetical protein
MLVPYALSKISYNIHCIHPPLQSDFQNALAYFAMMVTYDCKMYMKFATVLVLVNLSSVTLIEMTLYVTHTQVAKTSIE